MTNVLQDAAAWLAGQLKEKAGRTVTYSRNEFRSNPITGWVAKKEYESVGSDGLQTLVTSFDWTFEATDIVVNGSQITPRPGDIITEIINGTTIIYEVLPIENRPATEWQDDAGVMVIARTRKVA